MTWTLDIDPLEFWQGPASGIAIIGAVDLAQSPEVRERMFAAYLNAIVDHLDEGYLHLDSQAKFVISRA